MSDMYFKSLPDTSTPLIPTNLNKLNDIKVSPTQPETGEKVWIDDENNIIKTKNDDGTFKTIYDKNDLIELQGRPNPANYGIGGQCKPVSGDWNTACGNATGFYMGHELSNAPFSGWIYVIHMVHNENYAKQLAMPFTMGNIWVRNKSEGTWSGWQQLH